MLTFFNAYPRLMRIRQSYDAPRVEDIPKTVHDELAKLRLDRRIRPGQSVAVPVGSRGVENIAVITRALVDELKALGAEPFIVPAMGSHGGGTAEGQREIVEGYGVTESAMGVPIKASMDTVEIGRTEDGMPVYFDRYALQADHVVVVNRIKPHPEFFGSAESGLMKMLLIGLGKHTGAEFYHALITRMGFDRLIATGTRVVLDKCSILFGLAILENQRHETARLEAIEAEQIPSREPELLEQAKAWMPQIPFRNVDIVILDEIGKDVSGSGYDTTTVGRKKNFRGITPGEYPQVKRIYVRDLTKETHGNAVGVGMADFTRTCVVEKMDRMATYINCITSNGTVGGAIPIYFDTDREVLDAALITLGNETAEEATVVWLKNTLALERMIVSESLKEQVEADPGLIVEAPPRDVTFDASGNLVAPAP